MIEGPQGQEYTIYWRGYPPGQRRDHGVGLAIRNTLLRDVTEEPTYINERLMYIRLPLAKNEYATIVAAYAPTLKSDDEVKDEFYTNLDRVLHNVNKTDKIILLGDFNARVGSRRDLWGTALGHHGVGNMNDNGLRLLSLCCQHDLCITNTMFRLKQKYKTSWMHPRSKQWHLIDYIIVRSSQLSEVIITRAMRGADCWTDHRLIISKMYLKIRPPTRKRAAKSAIVNCSSLKSEHTRTEYQSKVAQLLAETEIHDALADWESFALKLTSVAKETLGLKKKKTRDWFAENDSDIRELLDKKNKAHQACLRNPASTYLREKFSDIRATTQRRLREIENQWWQEISREIQGYADANNIQQFYEATKRIYGPPRRAPLPVRSAEGDLIKDREGVLNRWAEHFSTLLNNHTATDPSVLDELPTLTTMQDLDAIPTMEEVVDAVSGLKNNKAAGPDSIPAELFVYGGTELHKWIHQIIVCIWQGNDVPQLWKDAILTTIYKNKGDRAECGNSRGIALLGTAGKILARVLLKRLVREISEEVLPESQCGFRANRSTIDMIFSARQLMEKCREQKKDLYIAFVDLSKAFDSVDREMLWLVLRKCGCPEKYIDIIKQLHEGMQVKVRVATDLSESFEVSRGVKQGCVLAPVLFNIYVQCITYLLTSSLRERCSISINYRLDRNLFDLQKLKAKTKVCTALLRELQYADDCAMVAHSSQDLQDSLNVMTSLYDKLGLKVNVTKTEVMCYNAGEPQTSPITLGEAQLKEVNSFKYLGSYLSSDCRMDDEVMFRIGQANSAFGRLRDRVFTNHDLKTVTKVMVYKAVVLPSLLYGSESWTLYRGQIRILERFHIKSLQLLLGISWKDKIPHSEILKRTDCTSIEYLLNRAQLRWVGHVVRMPRSRIPKQLLYGELTEGKRSAGGQLLRFKDTLKRSMKACYAEPSKLEELAGNRPLWRSEVKSGLQRFEEDRHLKLQERREKRHRASNPVLHAATTLFCTICDRPFSHRLGLHSHMRNIHPLQ